MKTKMKKLLLTGLLTLPMMVQAACDIPSKLLDDVVLDDITSYVLGADSLSEIHLKDKGFDTYTDYVYSTDSYSAALLAIQENYIKYGEGYAKGVGSELAPRLGLMEKGMRRYATECGYDEYKKVVIDAIDRGLSGKDLKMEMKLHMFDLNGLTSAL